MVDAADSGAGPSSSLREEEYPSSDNGAIGPDTSMPVQPDEMPKLGEPSSTLPTTNPSSGNPSDPASSIAAITAALDALTNHADTLPSGSDLKFNRVLSRQFARNLDYASSKVLQLAEQLLEHVEAIPGPSGGDASTSAAAAVEAGPSVLKTAKVAKKDSKRQKLEVEEDVVDGFKRSVGGVLDGLLEDADSRLDEVSGKKNASKLEVDLKKAAAAMGKLPGPFANTVVSSSGKRGRLPADILHGNVKKPQTLFPDKPNNSVETVWAPNLPEKPHAMVPLGYPIPPCDPRDLIYKDEDNKPAVMSARRREKAKAHPYYYETEHLPYPTRMFELSPPIPPRGVETIQPIWVDSPEALDAMVAELKAAKEIAVDLEHHSMRSYFGFTCLIQISTREKDWVVDALKLRGQLREGKLGGVMVDPSIVKVFHGADSDVVWLQKDFDIYLVNLFDTYHATCVLGFQAHSLASLLSRYCSIVADKRYQMADWRIRPLTQEMLEYARSDTHFLLYIYDKLRNELLDMSRPPSPAPGEPSTSVSGASTPRQNPQAALRKTLELSAETALKLYEREGYDSESGMGTMGWRAPMKKWLPKGSEEEVEGTVFKAVHAWRDKVARGYDESPVYVMPNDTLKSISLLRILTEAAITRLVSTRPMIAQSMVGAILNVVVKGRAEGEREVAKRRKQKAKERGEMQEAMLRPTTSVASDVVAWRLLEVDELWSGLRPGGRQDTTVGSEAGARTTKGQSSLFGSTLANPTTRTVVASDAGTSAGPSQSKSTSSLFGSTFFTPTPKPARKSSPTFEEVSRRIVEALNPSRLLTTPTNEPAAATTTQPTSAPVKQEASNGSSTRLDPETVPFVPAAKRSTFSTLKDIAAQGKSAATSSSSATTRPSVQSVDENAANHSDDPQPIVVPPKKRPKDAIVDVKRKRPKVQLANGTTAPSPTHAGTAPKALSTADTASKTTASTNANGTPPAAGAGAGAGTGTDPASPSTSGRKKRAKVKASPANVTAFDYSKESNLLDYPGLNPATSGGKEMSKKERKKEKKRLQQAAGAPPPTMIETPNFGRAPRDLSQPKGGSRSQTFTS